MDHQRDVLLELLSDQGLRRATVVDNSGSGEVNQEEIPQLHPAPPAQTILSDDNAQLVTCKLPATDDSGDTHQYPPSSSGVESALNSKRPRKSPTDPEKTADLRKIGVCFKCKVTKARKGVSDSPQTR